MGTTAGSKSRAKQPQDHKVSTAAEWRARSSSGAEDITVPSGNVAKVKRVGPEAFLATGRVPDALTPIIEDAVRQSEGRPPIKDLLKLGEDPSMLPKIIDMMNHVVSWAVIEPRIEMPSNCIITNPDLCDKSPADDIHLIKSTPGFHIYVGEDRDPDVLYADEVDLDDKMFLFNYAVGGTRDLERFRAEQAELVGSLQSKQGDAGEAK